MKDCARYEVQLSALLDGELPEAQAKKLRSHLEACPGCAALYAAFAALSGAMEQEEPPEGLHAGIMAGIRAAPKPEKAPVSEKRDAGTSGKRRAGVRGGLSRFRPALTAAACLALIAAAVLSVVPRLGAAGGGAENGAATTSYDATVPQAAMSGGGGAPAERKETAGFFAGSSGTADSAQAEEETAAVRDAGASDTAAATEDARTPSPYPPPPAQGDSAGLVESASAPSSSYDTGPDFAQKEQPEGGETRLLLEVLEVRTEGLLCSVIEASNGAVPAETVVLVIPPESGGNGTEEERETAPVIAPGDALLVLPDRWATLDDGMAAVWALSLEPA